MIVFYSHRVLGLRIGGVWARKKLFGGNKLPKVKRSRRLSISRISGLDIGQQRVGNGNTLGIVGGVEAR